ncbi:carboxypeptidase regulatory-like domain-containing protein [Pyxidicoccus parkwayensis]|uniref:Carboxypeptidase regulatory-like domain-containing protein n=1 Tax=Pyxidicoccus parkwayensis TaxID=2813578 RepID=A0ABX7NKN3_9BACT|nr:carboxypeptidase regulatory-like domain-containing protein [Pyxidicoccus parkwaysis]QSQ19407.1 carboxypeptidase regulatory-like domain-containing protein [Pyxidicoccus parkwaysis]
MARLLLVLLVLATPLAQAEQVAEHASLRLRYGVSLRDGQQADVGPGLTYDGMTPNDLAAVGTGWVGRWLGAWAGVQREAFDLKEGSLRITGGSLLRASVGPRARLFLGPVRAEVGAGYGFAQLPLFGDSAEPVLARGVRHAALVNGRVVVPLFLGLKLEARGELPVTLSAKDASGAEAEATGYSAGGALLVPLKRAGAWGGTLVLDFQHVRDTVTLADGTRSEQRLRRVGAALEFTWNDFTPAPVVASPPPERVPMGALSLRALDAETGAALPGARVVLGDVERVADAQGVVEVELPPGEVTARVSAEGFAPAEGRATVEDGVRAALEVRASRLPPPTGGLRVTVVNAQSGVPLPGVRVAVGATEVRTDMMGQARVKDLAPGPVAVTVKSPGFRTAEEAAVVVAGQEAALSVPLASERKSGPATLAGQVRSTRAGKPLAATLRIPLAKVRTRTDAKGAFSVRVKGGTYRITISAPGHLSQTKTVKVRDGEQAIFNVDLFPRQKR